MKTNTYEVLLEFLASTKTVRLFRHCEEKDIINKMVGDGVCKRTPYFQNVIEKEDGSYTFEEREVFDLSLTKKGYQKVRELEFIRKL